MWENGFWKNIYGVAQIQSSVTLTTERSWGRRRQGHLLCSDTQLTCAICVLPNLLQSLMSDNKGSWMKFRKDVSVACFLYFRTHLQLSWYCVEALPLFHQNGPAPGYRGSTNPEGTPLDGLQPLLAHLWNGVNETCPLHIPGWASNPVMWHVRWYVNAKGYFKKNQFTDGSCLPIDLTEGQRVKCNYI